MISKQKSILQQHIYKPNLFDQAKFRRNILTNKFGTPNRISTQKTSPCKPSRHHHRVESLYSQNFINSEKQKMCLQPGKYLSKQLEKIFDNKRQVSISPVKESKTIQRDILKLIDLTCRKSKEVQCTHKPTSPCLPFMDQEKPPDFLGCIFQPHQDCEGFLQIANNDQFAQVSQLMDQYYDIQEPKRRLRLGQFSTKHLNTQKNIDAVLRREAVRTKINEMKGVKDIATLSSKSIRGPVMQTNQSTSKTHYDYVSTLLGVMRDLDHEYTLNPTSNVQKKVNKKVSSKSVAKIVKNPQLLER